MKHSTLIGLLLFATPLCAQTAADTASIHATALDYIDGYYGGNVERMERALHALLRLLHDRRGYVWVSVAHEERPVPHDEVHELVAVDVVLVCGFCPLHEDRERRDITHVVRHARGEDAR